MSEKAYKAFERILKNRRKAEPIVINGYSRFLFLNREGFPKVAGNYEGMVKCQTAHYHLHQQRIIRSSKLKTAAQSHLSCRFLPLFLLFLVSGQ